MQGHRSPTAWYSWRSAWRSVGLADPEDWSHSVPGCGIVSGAGSQQVGAVAHPSLDSEVLEGPVTRMTKG